MEKKTFFFFLSFSNILYRFIILSHIVIFFLFYSISTMQYNIVGNRIKKICCIDLLLLLTHTQNTQKKHIDIDLFSSLFFLFSFFFLPFISFFYLLCHSQILSIISFLYFYAFYYISFLTTTNQKTSFFEKQRKIVVSNV